MNDDHREFAQQAVQDFAKSTKPMTPEQYATHLVSQFNHNTLGADTAYIKSQIINLNCDIASFLIVANEDFQWVKDNPTDTMLAMNAKFIVQMALLLIESGLEDTIISTIKELKERQVSTTN